MTIYTEVKILIKCLVLKLWRHLPLRTPKLLYNKEKYCEAGTLRILIFKEVGD